MDKSETQKSYDLEKRTLDFARRVNKYVNNLPKTISNIENGKQLVKSGGSVGANYREANECLSKKDFLHRIKISRKEAKESTYWIELSTPHKEYLDDKDYLYGESIELMKIFGSIYRKSEEIKQK